ncbi:hypothetical protein Salmuc_01353 [Salipiger mucosus DSM 16094]|uniref:Uncharacterized protein n=2 Tax=Salipiger mucosus TaxID=263378 RepID=S9S3K3_9RHOB|nr:hypothetical protein Salmuc_01353 [Salipiger mucosus DSM 16094]
MVTFHLGKPKRPGVLRFMHDGYWFKPAGTSGYQWQAHDAPRAKESRVIRWYGVTIRGVFIGFLIARKRKSPDMSGCEQSSNSMAATTVGRET